MIVLLTDKHETDRRFCYPLKQFLSIIKISPYVTDFFHFS